jgi:hypothetical protein
MKTRKNPAQIAKRDSGLERNRQVNRLSFGQSAAGRRLFNHPLDSGLNYALKLILIPISPEGDSHERR